MWSNSLTDTSKASKSQSTHLSSWPASLFSADPWNSSQSQVYQWNSPITCHSPSIWMTKMALVSLLEIFPKLNFKKHLCSYFESVHLDIFPWKWKLLSHVWLFATPYSPWDSPGQNTGVGSHSLSRGSSQSRDQTQVSCITSGFFYCLSHQGSPRILESVAYPFSRESFRPRNQTRVYCIEGRFFTSWATREVVLLIN